jgi:uncharacterized coiled-coil protein SlyX
MEADDLNSALAEHIHQFNYLYARLNVLTEKKEAKEKKAEAAEK